MQCFIIGHEVPADHPDAGTFSTGPNLWPKALKDEEFRTPIMEYQATMLDISKTLLKILSRGLPKAWGHGPEVMSPFAENDPSMPMRLLHYAPQEVLDERQFGGMFSNPFFSPSPVSVPCTSNEEQWATTPTLAALRFCSRR